MEQNITESPVSRGKITITPGDILIFIFCLWGIVLTLICNGEITTRPVVLSLLLCLYFYLRILFANNNKYALPVLFFIVLLGLTEAIMGLMQLYGFIYTNNLFKTIGTFVNPGPYAGFLAFIFPIALYYGICSRPLTKKTIFNNLAKIFAGLTGIVILSILPSTMSRASWLAAGVGSIVILYGYYNEHAYLKAFFLSHKNIIRIAFVVLFLVLIISFPGIYHLKKHSADGRILMWKVALNIIPKHPLGVGLGNFPGTYADAQAEYFSSEKASDLEKIIAGSPEAGFNEFIQIAVEWGVIPFFLFLIITIRSIMNAYKQKRYELIGSFISLLVFALLSFPFSLLPFLIIFVFLLSAIESGGANTSNIKIAKSTVAVFFSLIMILCILNRYFFYSAYKIWSSAQALYQVGRTEEAKKEYEKALFYLTGKEEVMMEYASVLTHIGEYETSNNVLRKISKTSGDPLIYTRIGKNYQQMKDDKNAEKSFYKAAMIVPNRLYPWYLLTILYGETGQLSKAHKTAEVVLTKEPKVRSLAIREMKEGVKKYLHFTEEDIEQYFQQKKDTLLLKSWHFLRDNVSNREIEQYLSVNTEWIKDIELAVATCRQAINDGEIPFDLFCEYILPPQIYDEPFENWREECLKAYSPLKAKYTMEICETLNNLFKKDFEYGENRFPARSIPWNKLKEIKKGDCYHMAKTLVYPLRSLGIPTTIDFIHSWGNASGLHCWNVAYIDNKMLPFMGRDSISYQYNPFSVEPDTAVRFPAKVFRKTFSINAEIEDITKNMPPQDIPYILSDNRIRDVSSTYFPVVDIKLNKFPDRKKFPTIYLSVFSNEWKPIAWAKNEENHQVVFKELKGNMLYLPVTYKNGNIIPFDYPFTVDNSGKINVLKPASTLKNKVIIEYLYPLMMENIYASGHKNELPEDVFEQIKNNTFRHRPENGKEYQLFYWFQNSWTLFNKQQSSENKIIYSRLPENALFYLADNEGHFIGRCFTINNGEIVWW